MLGSELVGGSMVGGQSGARSVPATPTESLRPRELCERCGLDIRHVKEVSSASDIKGRDHTLYLVAGQLDGGRWFDSVRDVAIVGKPGEHARMRTETRDWDFCVTDEADGFVIANLTFDQTPRGAWARVNAPGRNVHLRNIETKGSGRRANPTPGKRLGGKSGPTYFIPATSESATNHIVNVEDVHRGVFPRRHFGDRPTFVWLGRSHRGTLRVIDSHIESYPNNSIYATACPGSVEAIGTSFVNNGVSCGGRISHGGWKRCEILYDSENTTLSHANQPNHASVGMSAEQKKAGANGKPGPDIINTSVHMENVSKGGAAARAYDIYRPARFGKILRSDFHVERGTGDYDADIEIEGDVEEIRDCVFSGSNRQYASIVNTSGKHVTMKNCKFDYPGGRKRDKGNVDWR